MTKTPEIKGTSVLIVGYGREGKSVHRWLMVHYPRLRIGIADREVQTELLSGEVYKGAVVYNGEEYLFHLDEYDTVVRSPGVSPYLPEVAAYVKKGGHLTSATNIFFSLVRGTTVGITGTKGKSTTSSLIAHILKAHYEDVRLVGNIGVPMLDALDTASDTTVFVIELSSHQLYDCKYSPHIAVLLKIVPEHLDYYSDFMSYVRAKEHIYMFQKSEDHLVRNEKIQMPFSSHLLGNADNVAAAVKVAQLMHVSDDVVQRQLASFSPLPHRLEYVGEYRGVRFYNDSLATIPQATIHALEALGPDVVTLLVGGYDRNLDFTELGAYIRSHFIPTLILFPDTGEKIWNAIGEVQKDYTIQKFDVHSMEEAVRLAYEHTPRGKICLMSPASASYNMFRDYEDRGEQFKALVRALEPPR